MEKKQKGIEQRQVHLRARVFFFCLSTEACQKLNLFIPDRVGMEES